MWVHKDSRKKVKAVETKGWDLLDWGEYKEIAFFLSTIKEITQGMQCKKTLSRCGVAGSPNSWPSNSPTPLRPSIIAANASFVTVVALLLN